MFYNILQVISKNLIIPIVKKTCPLAFFIFVLGRPLRVPKKFGCLEISFRLDPTRENFTALLILFLRTLLHTY
jgi:hypothetical protein